MTAPGTKFIHADTFGNIFAGSRLIVVVMLFFVSFYRLDNTFASAPFPDYCLSARGCWFSPGLFSAVRAFLTTGVTLCQIVNTAKEQSFKFMQLNIGNESYYRWLLQQTPFPMLRHGRKAHRLLWLLHNRENHPAMRRGRTSL